MSRLSAPHTPELDDDKAELVRLEHERKILELQGQPLVGARALRDVQLADAVATPVAHGLGREATVLVSPPRGASSTGRITEVRATGGPDRSKFVVLQANGWGATITVDLVVL